jgi:hypothetical protein
MQKMYRQWIQQLTGTTVIKVYRYGVSMPSASDRMLRTHILLLARPDNLKCAVWCRTLEL